jgi:phage recombination protein Bet
MSTVQKYEVESQDWTAKVELWKRTFMKNASDDELELFANICKRTGLSPEMKQIYAVSRFDSKTGKEVFSFQTSIDGFRVIAERTGRYAPGQEPKYEYNGDKQLVCATAYVKKLTLDGTWHEVAATAFYDEYVQEFKDKATGAMKPSQFWARMPHVMLAKCAESLALRKAFPAELSGLYTQEEMTQAVEAVEAKAPELITSYQVEEIEKLLKGRPDLEKKLFDWAGIKSVAELPTSKYPGTMKAIDIHLSKEGS